MGYTIFMIYVAAKNSVRPRKNTAEGGVWWAYLESNQEPLSYQDSVLPLNYMPEFYYPGTA